MKKTILILAVIALLLIAYVSMKSEKATIETVPVMTESAVVVESAVDENAPTPDFIEEAIIIDDTMPDENDIAPVDEEVIGVPTAEAPAVAEEVVVAQ